MHLRRSGFLCGWLVAKNTQILEENQGYPGTWTDTILAVESLLIKGEAICRATERCPFFTKTPTSVEVRGFTTSFYKNTTDAFCGKSEIITEARYFPCIIFLPGVSLFPFLRGVK